MECVLNGYDYNKGWNDPLNVVEMSFGIMSNHVRVHMETHVTAIRQQHYLSPRMVLIG